VRGTSPGAQTGESQSMFSRAIFSGWWQWPPMPLYLIIALFCNTWEAFLLMHDAWRMPTLGIQKIILQIVIQWPRRNCPCDLYYKTTLSEIFSCFPSCQSMAENIPLILRGEWERWPRVTISHWMHETNIDNPPNLIFSLRPIGGQYLTEAELQCQGWYFSIIPKPINLASYWGRDASKVNFEAKFV